MELLLVRHALPERVENAAGPADPELSEGGHRQAELLADYLAGEPIAAVYSSPMRRALQTAAPLADRLGLDVVVIDDVAEFDRESNEYVPMEQLKDSGDPRFLDLFGPGSQHEPMDSFRDRVLPAIDVVIDAHPGQSVAVVCHGGVINTVLAAVLGLSLRTPVFFYPNYTSIHRVAASRSGIRSVITVNETSHLRNSGLPMGLFQKG